MIRHSSPVVHAISNLGIVIFFQKKPNFSTISFAVVAGVRFLALHKCNMYSGFELSEFKQ